MATVYEKHSKAFELVSAGALVVDGVQVGTLAFKFPKDGAGRLTCFFHIHGSIMVVGTASGWGYDKKSAALEDACRNLCDIEHASILEQYPSLKGLDCGGDSFDQALQKAGIQYFSAV
jgi:hypothetical protein